MSKTKASTKLLERAANAGIETKVQERDVINDTVTFWTIFIPSGKETRRLVFSSEKRADDILSTNFEKISFLNDYDAIVDLKTGNIEALLSPRGSFSNRLMERRLGLSDMLDSSGEVSAEDEFKKNCLYCDGPDGIRLEISPCSDNIYFLCGHGGRTGMRRPVSLTISLHKSIDYETAVNILETISNSLFFQIEIEKSVTLSLRRNLGRRRPMRLKTAEDADGVKIHYPSYEYDRAPISLYWYAKSARGMPLLQFLAYYQVVEFYFPNFTKLEAIRNARKILKNPTFRIDRESDLTKLVSSIAGSGRIGGSERVQMQTTVAEVLSLEEVKSYFEENEDVADVIKKKQKGITDKTINIAREGYDYRTDIASLLYDIRCRIVHTKNDGENGKSELLLPFSSAEDGLWAYIEVMQLVARHALIRSSSVLNTF